jgi:hypothetical protein
MNQVLSIIDLLEREHRYKLFKSDCDPLERKMESEDEF